MSSYRLVRGRYLPSELNTFDDLCRALLPLNPDDSLAIGTTAAQLQGLWLPGEPPAPEFASAEIGRSARQMRRSRRPEFMVRRREIPLAHRVIVDGIPMTSIARTWHDLAAVLSLPDLVAAGDRALQLGVTEDELWDMAKQLSGQRGVRIAKHALGYLNARSRSRPESHLRLALEEAGLTCFEVNVAIRDSYGGWLAEPDLSCEQARIALEYQGSDHANVARMRRDITRDTDLRRNEWLTCYYGPAEVFGRPWLIAPEVRRLILRRAPTLLRAA